MATWDDIATIALGFPEVTLTDRGGLRAWGVKSGGLAWERPLRKSDLAALGASAPTGDILGIRTVDVAAKEELLAADPAVFFTTPHFDGYPAVLARLAQLDPATFGHLFREIWLARASKKAVRAFLETEGGR
jgi:hypothetical protein